MGTNRMSTKSFNQYNKLANSGDLSIHESARTCPICTSSACGVAGGVIGMGFRVCGARQLSRMPTCCTQDTVHFGAQNFSVKYSLCRISGVYSASGIPGYPRCCEHQCTSPSSQTYR